MKQIVLSPLYARSLFRDGKVKMHYPSTISLTNLIGENVIACRLADRKPWVHKDMYLCKIIHAQHTTFSCKQGNIETPFWSITLHLISELNPL